MKIFHNTLGWINNELPNEGEIYEEAHGGKLADGVLVGHGSHRAKYTLVASAALTIKIDTLVWLREHLGEDAETACRLYAITDSNVYCRQVQVFMDIVRDRVGDKIIVTDLSYKQGVLLLEVAGLISTAKANALLALGNHTRGS